MGGIRDRILMYLGPDEGDSGNHAASNTIDPVTTTTTTSSPRIAATPAQTTVPLLLGEGQNTCASSSANGSRRLIPSDYYLLAHPSRPCFLVKDNVSDGLTLL